MCIRKPQRVHRAQPSLLTLASELSIVPRLLRRQTELPAPATHAVQAATSRDSFLRTSGELIWLNEYEGEEIMIDE